MWHSNGCHIWTILTCKSTLPVLYGSNDRFEKAFNLHTYRWCTSHVLCFAPMVPCYYFYGENWVFKWTLVTRIPTQAKTNHHPCDSARLISCLIKGLGVHRFITFILNKCNSSREWLTSSSMWLIPYSCCKI